MELRWCSLHSAGVVRHAFIGGCVHGLLLNCEFGQLGAIKARCCAVWAECGFV